MHRKILAVTVASLTVAALGGCAMGSATVTPAGATEAPSVKPEATIHAQTNGYFTYQEVPLPNGETIRCVLLAGGSGSANGVSCDWDHPLKTAQK